MPDIRKQLAGKTTKLASLPNKTKTADHPVLDTYQEGGFYRVPVKEIKPNPYQPRQYFDEEALNELAQSIKDKGVLQPIIIKREDSGQIFLVAGERRLRAVKMAKLEEIPAILTKGDSAEIALIENLQRENLKPVEESRSLSQMMDKHDYTQEDLAKIVGKSRTNITETLSLNKLPDNIKDECLRIDIPKRVLIQIARQKTQKGMMSSFKRAKSVYTENKKDNESAQRKRSDPIELALKQINSLRQRVQKIKIESLSAPEKENFLASVKDLRNFLNNILE